MCVICVCMWVCVWVLYVCVCVFLFEMLALWNGLNTIEYVFSMEKRHKSFELGYLLN